jgi:acyl-CoA hydrolase
LIPAAKTVKDSQVEMMELVLQTTQISLEIYWRKTDALIDIAAALQLQGTVTVAVTAAYVCISSPIHLGNIVRLKASVNRAFNTSMEVVRVEVEDIKTGTNLHSNTAFTSLNIDPVTKKPLRFLKYPETEDEKRRYEKALRRRELD